MQQHCCAFSFSKWFDKIKHFLQPNLFPEHVARSGIIVVGNQEIVLTQVFKDEHGYLPMWSFNNSISHKLTTRMDPAVVENAREMLLRQHGDNFYLRRSIQMEKEMVVLTEAQKERNERMEMRQEMIDRMEKTLEWIERMDKKFDVSKNRTNTIILWTLVRNSNQHIHLTMEIGLLRQTYSFRCLIYI